MRIEASTRALADDKLALFFVFPPEVGKGSSHSEHPWSAKARSQRHCGFAALLRLSYWQGNSCYLATERAVGYGSTSGTEWGGLYAIADDPLELTRTVYRLRILAIQEDMNWIIDKYRQGTERNPHL